MVDATVLNFGSQAIRQTVGQSGSQAGCRPTRVGGWCHPCVGITVGSLCTGVAVGPLASCWRGEASRGGSGQGAVGVGAVGGGETTTAAAR